VFETILGLPLFLLIPVSPWVLAASKGASLGKSRRMVRGFDNAFCFGPFLHRGGHAFSGFVRGFCPSYPLPRPPGESLTGKG